MLDETHQRLEREKWHKSQEFACAYGESSGSLIRRCVTEKINDDLTIGKVCLLMNIVPCQGIDLVRQFCKIIIEHCCETKDSSQIRAGTASIVNDIGERGAASLSEILKSNTSLTKLDLGGGYQRNNTKVVPPFFFFFIHIKSTDNIIGERGAASMSDALKSNTTLTELDLSCEDKRNNTQMPFTSNSLFSYFHQTNSQQDWRNRSNITE